MSPPSRRDSSNPIVGILRCKCGHVMKVRRKAVERVGKCRACGRTIRARRERIEARPKKGEFLADPTHWGPPGAGVQQPFSDPFAEPAPAESGEDASPSEQFIDPFAQAVADDWDADQERATEPGEIGGEAGEPAESQEDDLWAEESWDADFGARDRATDPFLDEDAEPADAPEPAVESPCDEADDGAAVASADIPMASDVYSGVKGMQGSAPEDTGLFDTPLDPDDTSAGLADDAAASDSMFDVPLELDSDVFADAEGDDEDREAHSHGDVGSHPGADETAADEAHTEVSLPDAAISVRSTTWDGWSPPADHKPGPDPRLRPVDEHQTMWDAVAPPAAQESDAPDSALDAPPATGRSDASTTWDAVAPGQPTPPPARLPTPKPRELDREETTGWDALAPTDSRAAPPPARTPTPAPPPRAAHDSFEEALAAFDPDTTGEARGDAGGPRGSRRRGSQPRPGGAHGSAAAVGRQRAGWAILPLTLLTLSVYYYVWVYRVFYELRAHLVRRNPTSPGLAVGLHFVPVVNVVWAHYVAYRMAADLNEVHHLEGREPALAAGGVAAMCVSASLLWVLGAVLAMQIAWVGVLGMFGGLLLWGLCWATVQSALNAHWALHER